MTTRRFWAAAAATTLALAAIGPLTGCASAPVPADYAAEKPVLDLKTYFNGELTAHGIFTDRSGKVVRRFTVAMTGTWQGAEGTLDERFTYSDGTTERRVWRLTDLGNGRWKGRAALNWTTAKPNALTRAATPGRARSTSR